MVFIVSNLIFISVLVYTGYKGITHFMAALPHVLLAMSAVNSVTAGAYNYANARSKEYEDG